MSSMPVSMEPIDSRVQVSQSQQVPRRSTWRLQVSASTGIAREQRAQLN